MIIVAQRVGTILNADEIVVMDEGRVVGIGTHRELLETNETYREIVYSQLSERRPWREAAAPAAATRRAGRTAGWVAPGGGLRPWAGPAADPAG